MIPESVDIDSTAEDDLLVLLKLDVALNAVNVAGQNDWLDTAYNQIGHLYDFSQSHFLVSGMAGPTAKIFTPCFNVKVNQNRRLAEQKQVMHVVDHPKDEFHPGRTDNGTLKAIEKTLVERGYYPTCFHIHLLILPYR